MQFSTARKLITEHTATGYNGPATQDDVAAAHIVLGFRRSEPLGKFANIPDVAAFAVMLAASVAAGRIAVAVLAGYYIAETYRKRRELTTTLLADDHSTAASGTETAAVAVPVIVMMLIVLVAGSVLALSALWPPTLRLIAVWGLYRTGRDELRKRRENATCAAILDAGRNEPWYLGWLAATDRVEAARRHRSNMLWDKQSA
jgi:hypothetical protein